MMNYSEALLNCSLIRCLHPSYSYIGSEDIDVSGRWTVEHDFFEATGGQH